MDGTVKLFMVDANAGTVVLNQFLDPRMVLRRNDDKSFVWNGFDFSNEDELVDRVSCS